MDADDPSPVAKRFPDALSVVRSNDLDSHRLGLVPANAMTLSRVKRHRKAGLWRKAERWVTLDRDVLKGAARVCGGRGRLWVFNRPEHCRGDHAS